MTPYYVIVKSKTFITLFKAYDLNQDGKISRQEFQIMAENCYFAMKSQ